MYTYTVYGFCIHSEVELSGLLPGGDSPDVTIIRRRIVESSRGLQDNGGEVILAQIYDDIRFIAKDGKLLVVDVLRPLDEDELRSYLLGVLMAIVLRQRGFLVLHACGLVRDGQAIGFVGDSGWGKSTLANHFCSNGFSLLNDDVMAIRFDASGSPIAFPGPDHIKLRPGAAASLVGDFNALPQLHARTSKRVARLERPVMQPVPLHKLYVLEKDYRSDTAIEPLAPRESLMELMRHTRMTHVFESPAYQAAHLQQCARLIKQVPVVRLQRRKDLGALAEVVSAVEHDRAPAQLSLAGS